jgi:HK97 family phage portal protein
MARFDGLMAIPRAIRAAFKGISHSRTWSYWGVLNRTSLNYAGLVRSDSSSIVMACVRWVQRTFTEAPPILEQWMTEREDWQQHQRDPILDLLERPNAFYTGATLWKATIADLMLGGTAYWIKVRSRTGRVVELWWAPASTMEPMPDPDDDTVFIDHYEYLVGMGGHQRLRVEDVIQFRDGIDPYNPRKGVSPMRSLMREVFTDDEAANMTASLLSNMGVPGVVISPEQGTIGQAAAENVRARFDEKVTGDNKGKTIVMEGATKIETFGFSPEQMQLRALRGIPEERITAVLGVNAAVVGLGAGLSTTKVGATLREYREEAFESTIIPMYRELASELTHQLLPDFRGEGWRMQFDLTKIRVLQEDENKSAERLGAMLGSGGITVAEYRRALGYIALPEHEVYLRAGTVKPVPAGQSPDEQAALPEPAPAAPAANGKAAHLLELAVLAKG